MIQPFAVLSGSAAAAASETTSFEKMKRSHGILGIIGWGLILPCGAMIAKFLKHKEPLWYYLHTVIQLVGFLIILAGVIVGQALYNRIHPDIAAHRGIGYFALSLSITQVRKKGSILHLYGFSLKNRKKKLGFLSSNNDFNSQVLAFFIRPDKESKIRRLWAAYHRWFGVITLFFGALNIVLGIQVGGAGSAWKIGYGFLLGTILVTAIVLQVLSMLRSSDKPTPPSTYQMS